MYALCRWKMQITCFQKFGANVCTHKQPNNMPLKPQLCYVCTPVHTATNTEGEEKKKFIHKLVRIHSMYMHIYIEISILKHAHILSCIHTLHSSWTFPTRLAISRSCEYRVARSSLSLRFDFTFSCQTKQDSNATTCSIDASFSTPLKINSDRTSSSALEISHATFPLSSTTSSAVAYL